jgi:hypothetical protein
MEFSFLGVEIRIGGNFLINMDISLSTEVTENFDLELKFVFRP